jgi:acid phosphatase type 7
MPLFDCVLFLAGCCWSHADVTDDHLFLHFAVGTHPIVEGTWRDTTGRAIARLHGSPAVNSQGTSEALAFRGNERLLIEPVSMPLPTLTRSLSLSAWVRLSSVDQDGEIIGQTQKTGVEPTGWMLGHAGDRWCFALSAEGSEGGRDRFIKVQSPSPINPGKWYYLVATYDGQAARLYENGKLVSESHDTSGAIIPAPGAELVVGGRPEGDEKEFLQGDLLEVKGWDRVLAPAEIMLVALRNKNLTESAPAAEQELAFLVEPILQFGTKESMTFVCETSRPTKVEVHFGKNALLGKKVASEQPSLITELTASGLEVHSEYFYRVDAIDETGKKISSKLRSFQTAPPADKPWAFGVIGDTQRNPEITRRCAEGIYSCRPNFMLHCGDVVDDGFAKNQWLKDLFEPCKELMAYVPTFPVIGNHEKDSHWYYDYFALPKPEHRYTFEYGNAEFFMVDTNRPLKPGSEQYQWLEKELSESKATWKIAAHHHPCFSSDNDDYGDHLRGRPLGGFGFGHPNAKHAIKLYEKYGVDVVFNGHIHVYERTWPIFEMAVNLKKGIRYITSGGGGGGLEEPSPQRTWFSLHVNKAYHYCHVAVFDRTMVFKAYDVDGRLFDSFEMTKADDR